MTKLEQKKQDLRELKEWVSKLEREIEELEDKLAHEPKSLGNKDACHNQPVFAKHDCPNCKFEKQCVFEDKADYGKYHLK